MCVYGVYNIAIDIDSANVINHDTLYTIYIYIFYNVFTVHYTVYEVQCTLYTVHCTLYSVQYTLSITQLTLYIPCTVCIYDSHECII